MLLFQMVNNSRNGHRSLFRNSTYNEKHVNICYKLQNVVSTKVFVVFYCDIYVLN